MGVVGPGGEVGRDWVASGERLKRVRLTLLALILNLSLVRLIRSSVVGGLGHSEGLGGVVRGQLAGTVTVSVDSRFVGASWAGESGGLELGVGEWRRGRLGVSGRGRTGNRCRVGGVNHGEYLRLG